MAHFVVGGPCSAGEHLGAEAVTARLSFAGQCGSAALAREGVEPEHFQVWVGEGEQAEE